MSVNNLNVNLNPVSTGAAPSSIATGEASSASVLSAQAKIASLQSSINVSQSDAAAPANSTQTVPQMQQELKMLQATIFLMRKGASGFDQNPTNSAFVQGALDGLKELKESGLFTDQELFDASKSAFVYSSEKDVNVDDKLQAAIKNPDAGIASEFDFTFSAQRYGGNMLSLQGMESHLKYEIEIAESPRKKPSNDFTKG